MSFDLYVFERDEALTAGDIYGLLEVDDDKRRGDSVPGPRTAALLHELEERWPGLDDDPDISPWSTWPLWQPAGQDGCAFNIGFSRAEEVLPVMIEGCARHGLVLFDPQTEIVHGPKPPRRSRNPFRRS